MTILRQTISRLRRAWYRAHGSVLADDCTLEPGVSLERGWRSGTKGVIEIGTGCELKRGVCLDAWGGSIVLGSHVFVGPYVVVYGHGGVTIGDNTLVSMHCRVLSSNHTVPPPNIDIRSQPDILMPTRIGRDVWLGAGVTVLGGVTIGDGCVVGAGAVVSHDLPPYSIAMGVPARVVRQRT